jgi:hypothetical protein
MGFEYQAQGAVGQRRGDLVVQHPGKAASSHRSSLLPEPVRAIERPGLVDAKDVK